MHKFVLDLITEWRKLGLPFKEATVVIAVSGGADSLALLLAIEELRARKKLDLRLVAAHFNHKLRGRESDADEEFLKHLANKRNFELAVGHGAIATEGNLEQNARHARYDFLAETAANLRAGHVLTAHTMNDQAETFLLNLIRGSGIDGLAGMRPVRELRSGGVKENGGKGEKEKGRRGDSVIPPLPVYSSPPLIHSRTLLIRPLLRWAKRKDTENFCREMAVEFRYDTMNEDMLFKRVRVRKMLLPMLKEFNPKIVETLAGTAESMQQLSAQLEPGGGEGVIAGPSVPPKLFSIKDLKALEPAALHLTVRSWLKNERGDLRSVSRKHIEAIEQLINSPKSGRIVELPGFGVVRKSRGLLSFENIKVDK